MVFIVVTSQQIFYETTAELGAGEELLLGPREPVQLDMFGESTTASEDRSDRETGESDCSLCGLLTGRSALALIDRETGEFDCTLCGLLTGRSALALIDRETGESDCSLCGLLTGRSALALTLRSLTLYIYGAPILDVSRSHTTTQHSR